MFILCFLYFQHSNHPNTSAIHTHTHIFIPVNFVCASFYVVVFLLSTETESLLSGRCCQGVFMYRVAWNATKHIVPLLDLDFIVWYVCMFISAFFLLHSPLSTSFSFKRILLDFTMAFLLFTLTILDQQCWKCAHSYSTKRYIFLRDIFHRKTHKMNCACEL